MTADFGIHEHGTIAPHSHDQRNASRKSLWLVLVLIVSFIAAEAIGGIFANSLALLADAGHMVTDAFAIALALAAIWLASRPASAPRTFGFRRAEVLAAFLNGLSLWLITAWIFIEAFRRFQNPPEVQAPLMLGIGFGGLVINSVAVLILMRSSRENVNTEGAFLHVLSDLLGSIVVVAGGIVIIALGWQIVDPILSVIIGILILASSTRLLWKVMHVLLEGTPAHLNLDLLCRRLEQVDGVTGVHDLHVWSVTSGYEVLTAHITSGFQTAEERDHLLQHLHEIASQDFGVSHVTIQLEASEEDCVEDHHVSHPNVLHS